MSSEPTRRFLHVLLLAGSLAFAWLPATSFAKVFHARDEALSLAFPGADKVEPRDFYLTAEQHRAIEAAAKVPVESDLVTVYVGTKDGAPVGYAVFDTRQIRTYPATMLVVVSPAGTVDGVHVLSFHEPEEYVPTPRWRESMKGARLDDELEVGRGVAAVTGSTLSTRAVTSTVRLALAIWTVLLQGK